MLDLLPPPTIQALETTQAQLARVGEDYHHLASDHTSTLHHLVQGVLKVWRETCKQTISGSAPTLPFVDSFRDAVGRMIEASRSGLDIGHKASLITGQPITTIEDLRRGVAQLERLYAHILPRWQKGEDMEDLAAEELAPSADQLTAVAARHGFPQAWYEEDSKPLSPKTLAASHIFPTGTPAPRFASPGPQ